MLGTFNGTVFLQPVLLISKPGPAIIRTSRTIPYFFTRTLTRKSGRLRRFVVFAENGNGLNREPEPEQKDNGFNGQGNSRNGERPTLNFRWTDLLDPDPENIFAVGLTGLLTWASVQVLWQLFFISLAILVAAVKYSFIAALLLFILITLL
ncbi:uncharacterized protein LOC122086158 [Macadamia integrifolia]|uniref:uncharacterized protein LOC122086158 n=1 Tax=Macadamia integrifolia TaxID=60698 RepID=UPI001C500E48|nr:uncharacterized protein LOC122086158 [Macadamia integrifolia]